MLRAIDIIPRNPETPKPRTHGLETPPTSETSSRKGEYTKVKRDDESGSEIDDEDSLSRIEKALLVCFRIYIINYWRLSLILPGWSWEDQELEGPKRALKRRRWKSEKKVEEGRQRQTFPTRSLYYTWRDHWSNLIIIRVISPTHLPLLSPRTEDNLKLNDRISIKYYFLYIS